MSHWLDERAHNHRHLLRRVRMLLCNYVYDIDVTINQGAGGSVGSGEAFNATDGTAVAGRVRLTCTTGGGSGTAVFSIAYTDLGSPPALPSPIPTFSGSVTAGVPFQENGIYIYISTSVDWVVGNFIDIDYDTNTNTTPWTERFFLDDQGNSPNFSGELQFISQGPGAGSPESDITVGLIVDEDSGASKYNIGLNGFDAYTDTSPFTAYASQPNKSPDAFIQCDLNASDFWLTVNARRFILLQRLASGRWNAHYGGLILPLAGEQSYAYPMFAGGMSEDPDYNSSTVSVRLSAFWDPGSSFSATPASPDRGCAFLRTTAGGYQDFFNKSEGNPEPGNVENDAYDNVVWPWAVGHNTQASAHRTQYPNTSNPGNVQQIGRTPLYDTGESPERIARAYVPVQSVLISQDYAGGAGQHLGFLDGVFFVPGLGQAAGNTFTLESPEVTYLVAANAYRSASIDFAAIRMDP